MTSATEKFLLDFHASHAGATSEAFGTLPAFLGGQRFSSSYEVLASAVPSGNEPVAVLDLACGDGHLLSLLAARAQAGLALSGADMSPAELGKARSLLGERAGLFEARAQELPFDDAHFDVVLCHMALMLMDEAPRVLEEIARVLKPGGTLAAVTGGRAPPPVALTTYLEIFGRHRERAAASGLRFGHPGFRSEEGVRELLSQRFKDVRVDEIDLPQRLAPGELWTWFLRMYDLYQLSESDRLAIEHEYLAAAALHAGADGKLEFPQALRYIQARSPF